MCFHPVKKIKIVIKYIMYTYSQYQSADVLIPSTTVPGATTGWQMLIFDSNKECAVFINKQVER